MNANEARCDDGPDDEPIIADAEPCGTWQAPDPPPERCPASDDPRDTDAMRAYMDVLHAEIAERVQRYNWYARQLDIPRKMEMVLR